MFDKITRLSFILSVLFIFFFIGYISHKYKVKKIFQTIEPIISYFELKFNIDLDRKFGDRENRGFSNNSTPLLDTNFSLENKPNDDFDHYLLIKQDKSTPVLMNNPSNVVWRWDMGKFRNPTKIIPYLLIENGDLILGRYETKGIYRINKYGKIIWQNDSYNHHWISYDKENLYIPGTIFIDQEDLKEQYFENTFIKNCETKIKSRFGTILIIDKNNGFLKQDISLLHSFYSDPKTKNIIEKYAENCDDTFHLNDVVVLTEKEAQFFEGGIEGDFLVSFRHLNMVALVDKNEHNIKWYVQGKFKYQHSPRVTKNGTILIFDNYYMSGRSRIVEIDINSKEILGFFSNTKNKFFSNTRGRIQLFDDRILIQSSDQGEIFEIICKDNFKYLNDKSCQAEYVYSSIFSGFYPFTGFSIDGKYVKDMIYIGDFYKNLNFFK